ncbi:hypothetical protein GN074_08090 [Helicobacter pylori]|nr:hypothetical protein [Helicobacter pylori]MWR36294.1 hypothetical protein [Helicobacter pylori]
MRRVKFVSLGNRTTLTGYGWAPDDWREYGEEDVVKVEIDRFTESTCDGFRCGGDDEFTRDLAAQITFEQQGRCYIPLYRWEIVEELGEDTRGMTPLFEEIPIEVAP